MNDPDIIIIIIGMLQHDPAALEWLMDKYSEDVYKLISRILRGSGNSRDIEECCSDTFVNAWEKIRQFDDKRGSFRTWLLILARYKALDYRRHLLRERTIEIDPLPKDEMLPNPSDKTGNYPQEHLLQKERQEEIIRALKELSRAEREILYRRYFLEESIDTIASDLRISRGAADNRLWRARRSLKLHINGNDEKVVPING